MSAQRYRTGAAAAIVALMVFSTLAGVVAIPHTAAHGAAASPATSSPDQSSISTDLPAGTPATLTTGAGAAPNQLPATPTAPLDASGSAPSARTVSTLDTLRSDGVPLREAFLPNLNVNPDPSLSRYGTVTPSYATGGPAPVGVAEYGIFNESGTLVPVTLSTTDLVGVFEGENFVCEEIGNCTPKTLAMDSGAPDYYGLQLNAVLENVTLFNTPGYDFWTQQVIEYSTYSHELYLITNIWNFTSVGAGMTTNALAEHGPNGTVVPGELYYSESGPFKISADYTAIVSLNSLLIDGDQGVTFSYDIFNGTTSYSGSNDFAIFNSTGAVGPGASSAADYIADGSQYTPLGIPADWEFVMGGPGGGSNLDVFSMYSIMDLYYFDSLTDSYRVVPSAYDVGSETGETSTGETALWEGDWAAPGPAEILVPGPTFVTGMWNVTNSTQGFGVLFYELAPSNGFTFFGQTLDPFDYPAYAWAPPKGVYLLPPAEYGIWALASNFDPDWFGLDVGNGTETTDVVTLTYYPLTGVYTPLWALNESGLDNITWNGVTLFSNAYGVLGYDPALGFTFPFFAAMNDYTYPVFPGILLWNVYEAQIINPPAFTVEFPSTYDRFLDYFGLPTSNDLPILAYDTEDVSLQGAAAIGGWWFTEAEYGPTVPAYNVVFWNSSFANISNNHFATSSDALYLYGGFDAVISNNTFVQTIPYAPDPIFLSGVYFGTYALFEADYGDYAFGGDPCECWDIVYNNVFDTYFTAISPLLDPYTGHYPIDWFSEQWNLVKRPGTNIIGGDYIGGNYWWNYGTDQDPYGVLPYRNFQLYYLFLWDLDPYGIFWGGDYVPLTPTPVVTVTFVELGLAPGTDWSPLVEAPGGGYVANFTTLGYSNESWVDGVYNLTGTASGRYAYVGNTTFVVTGPETVYLEFAQLLVVSFEEHGLPAGSEWVVILESFSLFEENFSTTAWANFSVPAGDYDYYSEALGYFAAPHGSGEVDVAGPTTVPIAFVPLYSVTFDQSGLTATQDWTIVFRSNGPGGNGSESVNGTSVFLGYAYGGYTYTWQVVAPGYVATPASGSFTLNANETVSITFAASESLTFDESGLAAGSAWTVELTQGSSTTTETSTGTSITFSAMAGAYSYTVSAAGYVPGTGSGSGTLPGGPIDVVFSPAPADVDFEEVGLPAGAQWTVEFTQDATTTPYSGSGTISIEAVYGAYSYGATSANFTAVPATGVGVLPENTPVVVEFIPTPASVEFEETGLAAGTHWTVEFTQDSTTTGYSGTGTISINAVAGAYSYTISAANYSATPASGTGTLPADGTVSVAFTLVDGKLSGTITPTDAAVTVGGTAETLGAGGTLSVTLAPGTYTVAVRAAGYYPYNTTVTIASGKTTDLSVVLKSIPSTPKPFLGLSNSSDWLLVGLLVALVLVLLAVALVLVARGRRPPEAPPKGWSSGAATPKDGAGTGPGGPEWSEGGPGNPPSGST